MSKPIKFRLFWLLCAGEGLLVLALLFRNPSSEQNAWLLGYSPARLMLIFFASLAVFATCWAAARSLRQPDFENNARSWLEKDIIEKERLLPLTTGLLLGLLLLLGLTIFFITPIHRGLEDWLIGLSTSSIDPGIQRYIMLELAPAAASYAGMFNVILNRAFSLLIWLMMVKAQALVLLFATCWPVYHRKWQDGLPGRIANAMLLVLILSLTLFHWLTLLLRLKTLVLIPGWKWYFGEKPHLPSHWLFVPILVLMLLSAWYILTHRHNYRINLVLLIFLGYAIPVGFGFIEGGGFESLRLTYADSVFNNYAWAAAKDPPLIPALRSYESLYGSDWYLGTKPPGVLAIYILTLKASNWINPAITNAGRFLRLTTFAAYVYPLIACLVVLVLFHFSRALTGNREDAILPSMLYITCPNVILIPLFLDQVFYPLIFMLVLALAHRSIERQSVRLCILLGASIYAALYFSFSLLPLLPLTLLWITLDGWLHHHNVGLRQSARLVLAILGGLAAALLAFRLLLNYDFLLRYQGAMAQHVLAKSFEPSITQLLNAIYLNSAEFITWTGIPLAIFAFLHSLRSSQSFLSRQSARLNSLSLAFMATYVALNLLGRTYGEVLRLWLFLVPLVVLFAVQELTKRYQNKDRVILLLLAMQLVTAFLLFKYQDFYG